jgi:hypothetical protein
LVDISRRYIDCQYTEAPSRLHVIRIRPVGSSGSTAQRLGTSRYTAAVRRHTDYTLARRAVLRDLERGRLTRLDVCDAHPELLRAARNVGLAAGHDCPVCSGNDIRHVAYVYGNDLRGANGRCIVNASELEELGAAHDEFACYVVEVCPDCRWNHLARRELHGRRYGAGAHERGAGAGETGEAAGRLRR